MFTGIIEQQGKVKAIETEGNIDYSKRFKDDYISVINNVTNAISHATCAAAYNLDAKAIISSP